MKTPQQNIIKVFKGKRFLFLENDTSLNDGLDEFEKILKESKIEYKVLFEISEMPLEEVTKLIGEYDGIVFMTQWVYDVSKQLKEYMFALKDKKIVVEVYIDEPTWSRKPKVAHDVYIYTFMESYSDKEEDLREHEKFYKLRPKTSYWDYKNKFDK